jgi:uncharacterized protein YbbC (DUF1343 family)
MMQFGIDRLVEDPQWASRLARRRVAVLGHPASVDRHLNHSLDLLGRLPSVHLTAALGPQHGLKGDQQDNMKETPDEDDPARGLKVFSLYGEVRRPTPAMLDAFDVLLVDLQDLGCRIYTFLTTLRYVMEAAAATGKTVWVLDRPNPAGRPVEGFALRSGWESFVGAGRFPMRHGLTLGEAGDWLRREFALELDYEVVPLSGWQPHAAPGYGWPLGERSWVNPSPNAASLSMARAYAGTVLLEGTTLSEGRGTTRPLELLGAPDLDGSRLLQRMQRLAPQWLDGCRLRPCWFEPTFHKHVGRLCGGFQIHLDDPAYDHRAFRPWRLIALAFKAIRELRPDYPLWRDFPYEYEVGRLAIDVINGSPLLREWVDDSSATPDDLDRAVRADEIAWVDEVAPLLRYP